MIRIMPSSAAYPIINQLQMMIVAVKNPHMYITNEPDLPAAECASIETVLIYELDGRLNPFFVFIEEMEGQWT